VDRFGFGDRFVALEDEVPYAIVLTFETPVATDTPIYTQVSERLAVRVPVRPAG
jgi:hypothetical protein